MPKADIFGLNIAYEVVGTGERTAAITVGGRFSKDTEGVRQLAEELAQNGMRVLIWDRPNCGESDLSLSGDSEWTLNADVLAALLRKLRMAPAFLISASAGTRISIMTAHRHPDVARKLSALWLSGGPIVLSEMAKTYYGNAAFTARAQGLEAVLEDPTWKENFDRNPGNRERLLSLDVDTFVSTMERWAWTLMPDRNSPVVGLSADDLRSIKVPALVYNSSRLDVHHQRSVTERLAELLPNSRLVEAPWSEREWYDRTSDPAHQLFLSLPMLTQQLLEFDRE